MKGKEIYGPAGNDYGRKKTIDEKVKDEKEMKTAEEIEVTRNSIILLCADRKAGNITDKQLENSVDLTLKMFADAYHKQKLAVMMPTWENIDNDDFIAEINGYVLRVEQMDTSIWWYSVSKGELELCNEQNAGSEKQAKRFAEGVYLQNYIKSLLTQEEK